MLDTQKSKQLITTSKGATALLPFCVNENRQFLMTRNIKLFYELLFSCVGGGHLILAFSGYLTAIILQGGRDRFVPIMYKLKGCMSTS